LSIRIPMEKLKEMAKKVQQAQPLEIRTGVDEEIIIFDAIERRGEVVVGAFNSNWEQKQYTMSKIGVPGDKISFLLSQLQEMKCLKAKVKVLGSRIFELRDVEVYEGEIPQSYVKVGRASRTSSGLKVRLETDEGTFLVSDFSVKGALLTSTVNDGDMVGFVGLAVQGSMGPILRLIHWARAEEVEGQEAQEQ